jgi:hypothetical protein
VAVILLAIVLTIRIYEKPVHLRESTASSRDTERLTTPQPLTVGSVNGLLLHSESFKAAIDTMAFRAQTTQFSKGTQSALAVLGKEKIKL